MTKVRGGRKRKLLRVIWTVSFAVLAYIGLHFAQGHIWQVRQPIRKRTLNRCAVNCTDVRIAVLDSGVDTQHPDLTNAHICQGWNFVSNDGDIKDTLGHGTAVVGILAADDNHIGVCGLCCEASIYPLKVLDDYGHAAISTIVNAIDWCIANEMDIINLSFSTSIDESSLSAAIIRAQTAGIIVVAAVDNRGKEIPSYPAYYDGVIAVSAGKVKDISMDNGILLAPGHRLFCLDINGTYQRASGSSVAAPIITGLIARQIASSPSQKTSYIHDILSLFQKGVPSNEETYSYD